VRGKCALFLIKQLKIHRTWFGLQNLMFLKKNASVGGCVNFTARWEVMRRFRFFLCQITIILYPTSETTVIPEDFSIRLSETPGIYDMKKLMSSLICIVLIVGRISIWICLPSNYTPTAGLSMSLEKIVSETLQRMGFSFTQTAAIPFEKPYHQIPWLWL